MNIALSEEQEMLRKMARDFLTDKCPKTLVREMEADEKGYSPELWRGNGRIGLDGAGWGWMGLDGAGWGWYYLKRMVVVV